MAAGLLSAVKTSSTGKPLSRHPKKPPSRGRTRVTPSFFSLSAKLALLASLGQVQ